MAERPRFFDDLAGVAGGAFSALSGLRDEAESTIRARVDEAIRRFDLVKREDLEAVQEMAATARAGQETAELRLAALEAKVEALTRAAAAPAHPATHPATHPAAQSSAHSAASASTSGAESGAEAAAIAMPGATATPIPPPAID